MCTLFRFWYNEIYMYSTVQYPGWSSHLHQYASDTLTEEGKIILDHTSS